MSCYTVHTLGRVPNHGQTQPPRPTTMSLTYLYCYGVGSSKPETSAGTSVGALEITSTIKCTGMIPIPVSPIQIPKNARTPDYHRLWTLNMAKERIKSWCRMYLRKKKLKPMAVTSMESVRKVARLPRFVTYEDLRYPQTDSGMDLWGGEDMYLVGSLGIFICFRFAINCLCTEDGG